MLGSFWSGATIGTYWLRMDSAGDIKALTSKSGYAGYPTGVYMSIGTMPTGWTQVKMTLNFTSDTYTFSTRPDTASAWTPMKAAGAPDYNIPMRGAGNQVSQTTLTFRAGGGTDTNVEFGLDDVNYDIPDALGCRRHLRGRHRRRRAVHLLGPCGHRLPERRVRRHRHLRSQAGLALRLPQGPGHPDDGHRRPRDRRPAFRRRLRDPLLGQHELASELPLHPRRCRRRRGVRHVLAQSRRRRQALGLHLGAGQPQRLHHQRLHPDRERSRPAGPSTSSPSTSQTTPTPSRRAPTPRRLGADEGRGRHRLRHPDARHRRQHRQHGALLPRGRRHRGQRRARTRRRPLLRHADRRRRRRHARHATSTARAAMRQAAPTTTTTRCASCHWRLDGPPRHAVSVSTLPADVTNCTPCHDASLTVEHNTRTPDAGGTFTCDTCHGSTDPLVKRRDRRGELGVLGVSRAGRPGHEALHGSDVASMPLGVTGFACGDCHAPTSRSSTPSPTSSSFAARLHRLPPDSARHATPPGTRRCIQGGCHATGTADAVHGSMDASHAPLPANASCFGTGCHKGTDLSAIHASAETTVAGVARRSCLVCHADGALPSTDCTTCHTAPGVDYHTRPERRPHVDDHQRLLRRRLPRRLQAPRHRPRQVRGHRRVVLGVRDHRATCATRTPNPTRINWAATAPHQRCTGLATAATRTRSYSRQAHVDGRERVVHDRPTATAPT